ncbi:hypothetical protein P3T25_008842 [Paraburkholderia sp. GAS32]
MRLFALFAVALLATFPHIAFAEDFCDIGGASRYIPLPRAVNINGVSEIVEVAHGSAGRIQSMSSFVRKLPNL